MYWFVLMVDICAASLQVLMCHLFILMLINDVKVTGSTPVRDSESFF